ncbi:hypothetical protein CKY20_06010 [Capnocytophaga canis]|uniref:Uncharacterized protein n=1 Tax=Capnocytophaga canis TaxID=1848903 RepID=A0A3A1YE59_9FLAO|nr:hypothetical protein CKY20_06010 [Capnocytophaga canis]
MILICNLKLKICAKISSFRLKEKIRLFFTIKHFIINILHKKNEIYNLIIRLFEPFFNLETLVKNIKLP